MNNSAAISASSETESAFVCSTIPWWRIGTIFVIAAATVIFCFTAKAPVSVSESGVVMDIPYSVGSYWGTAQEVTEAERVILPQDTEFAKKVFNDGKGNNITSQIVLAGAEKRSIHRPQVCLIGQGWTIEESKVIPIKLVNGSTLKVMSLGLRRTLTLDDGSQKTLRGIYLYWFVGKEVSTPYHEERIIRTNLDMLFHNTNHRWAYVIVTANVLEGFQYGGKNKEETLDMLENFVAEFAPKIMKSEIKKSEHASAK
jgi:hypothetical protein